MSGGRLDQMIERAVARICDTGYDLAGLPTELATAWPEAPALELTVALASAAEAVQSMFRGPGSCAARAQVVWQQAALVAAEVHYLAVLERPHATTGDLLSHWARDGGGG
jgi:hypothetical protein